MKDTKKEDRKGQKSGDISPCSFIASAKPWFCAKQGKQSLLKLALGLQSTVPPQLTGGSSKENLTGLESREDGSEEGG